MSPYRTFPFFILPIAAGLGLFSQARAEGADDVEHVCENELACIEDLYGEKKYEATDFAALKLIVGGEDSLSYNDNIFRAASNEESDIVNRFSPRLALRSDLDRHYWGLEVEAENSLYFSNSENNHTDFSAIADTRLDIGESASLSARGGYVLDHVSIGAFVDDPGALNVEPTPFSTFLGYAALDYLPPANPWHARAGFGAENIDYDNVARRGGGTDIQDDRDRVEYGGDVLLGYRPDSGSELYVKTVHEWWDHDTRIDSSAMSTRDAVQRRYLAGWRRDRQGAVGLRYDVAAGYLEHDYEAGRLPNVEGLDLYADADWRMDEANSLRLRVSRDVRDAYSDQRSAYLRTRVRTSYEHDYTEALTLGAGYGYINNDFESTSLATTDREDHVHSLHVWSAYEFYENFEANLYYVYTDRNSNDPNADYTANVIGLALSYKN